MAGDQIVFTPTHCSLPRDPGGAGLSEMETLRMFVNQRLTAAVEDIMAAFGRTVSRYREQIDRQQQQQLDGLKYGEGAWIQAADPQCAPSWIKVCPDEQLEQMVQADSAEVLGPGTPGLRAPGPLALLLNVKLMTEEAVTEPQPPTLTQMTAETTGD